MGGAMDQVITLVTSCFHLLCLASRFGASIQTSTNRQNPKRDGATDSDERSLQWKVLTRFSRSASQTVIPKTCRSNACPRDIATGWAQPMVTDFGKCPKLVSAYFSFPTWPLWPPPLRLYLEDYRSRKADLSLS